MAFETFQLERNQSLYENEVEINLTESGVEPLTLAELLTPEQRAALLDIRLGYNYTEGTPELRDAIATWYPGAGADNVLVTAGTAEANFITYWTLMRPGDAIAMMLPNFMQFSGLAAAFGHEVRPFSYRLTDAGWELDFDALEAALADGKVRILALVNPNNPTGTVMREEEMRRIVALADKAGAWIVSDEIYRGSELDDRPETPTFYGLGDRIIVTSSTSKSLAHAGLRLGWTVAPEALVAELMERQDYTTIGTGPMNQFVAARLLEPQGRGRILSRTRSIIAANLHIIEAWIGRWNGRLSYRRPDAGGMAFVRYDWPIGSAELSRIARERESVFVVAGEWFGMDGHLRIGTGGEPHVLEEGLARLDRLFATL